MTYEALEDRVAQLEGEIHQLVDAICVLESGYQLLVLSPLPEDTQFLTPYVKALRFATALSLLDAKRFVEESIASQEEKMVWACNPLAFDHIDWSHHGEQAPADKTWPYKRAKTPWTPFDYPTKKVNLTPKKGEV